MARRTITAKRKKSATKRKKLSLATRKKNAAVNRLKGRRLDAALRKAKLKYTENTTAAQKKNKLKRLANRKVAKAIGGAAGAAILFAGGYYLGRRERKKQLRDEVKVSALDWLPTDQMV